MAQWKDDRDEHAHQTFLFVAGRGAPGAGGGADDETGSDLLRCMINTAGAPAACRVLAQPTGVHCHAQDVDDLKPCFAILGAEILRLTR